ncbi:acetoacetate decarboxylase family protein [Verrucosispora sioxanthis]|uniref:Acetoacetate decarboxylase family protein n=1 Tax=Verrucosispora sioxanthis TaxID=2499994 RepID=A0A6M1KRP8_9ACTN|nr:acetoacetate decarboxylase family protein [Verrucosispora sioxanthis]NEE62256.1 acetoacetate decarboxylase family protein [Verrucosispora sioxanthis]NGM11366.1 acetoacetate decarboxylase family protein [Verrucosispora sioxanthis]
MLDPAVPHLVVNSRTLYFSWLPADPDAVAALVPPGLRPHPDREVFMNQYVVDDESQTSGFGSYSLTYLGVTLVGMDAPDGVTPGGWWTHYVTSSERVRTYALARGAPAVPGRTTITEQGDTIATGTDIEGVPVIRARVRVGDTGHAMHNGHHRYLTELHGQLVSSIYPVIAEPSTSFEIESVEFLDPDHPVYALRPENPLTIAWGYYSPRSSFAYPGGLTILGEVAPGYQVPDRRARSGLPSGS